jgi:hypothetical protein
MVIRQELGQKSSDAQGIGQGRDWDYDKRNIFVVIPLHILLFDQDRLIGICKKKPEKTHIFNLFCTKKTINCTNLL